MITKNGAILRLNPLHKISNYLIEGLSGLGIIALIFGIWQVGSNLMGSFILPAPMDVLARSYELFVSSDSQISTTLWRVAVATTLAFIAGSTIGMLAGSFKTLAKLCRPLMDILLGIAPIIWIVLALFWFGLGDVSVVFSVFIAIFPLSFASAMLSIITLDSRLKEVCFVYRLGVLKRLKAFILPHILPHLLNSLSIVFAMGVKIMIMAELLGSSNGVGAMIANARAYLDTTQVLAYVVIMVGVILLFNFLIITPLRIIFLPWLDNEVAK